MLQATNYTHYYYYNNNTFFFLLLLLFLPSLDVHMHPCCFCFLILNPLLHDTHLYYYYYFFLHRSKKSRDSYFIYLFIFSRSIHLSNQNLSILINKSNYVHKFLIFLTYKFIKRILIEIEIFQRISKVYKTN